MFGHTKKDIAIHEKYQKDLQVTEIDQGQIEQVLLNLYANACQAMPGGGETFEILKSMNPEARVILSSGYSMNGEAAKIMEQGCCAFIQKPFSMHELSQKIRQVLDQPKANID